MFGLVVVAGLVLRLLALRTSLAQQNSDTAVVYLMARHVSHGEFRVFYWGQFYGGTLLQLTAGALFWLTGASFAVLQIVEIAFWLAACLLLRSIVARGAGAVAGDLAGCFFWLATPLMVRISFTDGLRRRRPRDRARRRPPGAGGRANPAPGAASASASASVSHSGRTPLALAFAVPAVIWTCLRRPAPAAVAAGVSGAVLGAVPWLYETVKSGLQDAPAAARSPGEPVGPVPARLHAGHPRGRRPRREPAARAIGLVALAHRPHRYGGRTSAPKPHDLVLGVSALLAPVIIVASRVPIDPTAARYATYLIPSLAAILAWGMSRLRLIGVATVVLVCSWTIGTVWNSTNGLDARATPCDRRADHGARGAPGPPRTNRRLGRLLDRLHAQRRDAGADHRGRSLSAPGGEST